MDLFDDLDEKPNPAIAAKERIRAILLQQAEDVVNGVSNIKPPKEKKKPSGKADYNKATYNFYKSLGYDVFRVDYYDARFQRQHDLLGFADMLALKKGCPPLLVQLTSKSNMGERYKKILSLSASSLWLSTGGQIQVIGWEKLPNGRLKETVRVVTAPE